MNETPRNNAPKGTCPFCLMMRRATRNAVIGMTVGASVLAAVFFTYQRIGGIQVRFF